VYHRTFGIYLAQVENEKEVAQVENEKEVKKYWKLGREWELRL